MHLNKISIFLKAAVKQLYKQLKSPALIGADGFPAVFRILHSRIAPELEYLGEDANACKRLAVQLNLALLAVDSDITSNAVELFESWMEDGFWRSSVDEELKSLVSRRTRVLFGLDPNSST